MVDDQGWVAFDSHAFDSKGADKNGRKQSSRGTSRTAKEPGVSDSASWVPIRPRVMARSSTRSVSAISRPSSPPASSQFPPRTVRLPKANIPPAPKASSKPQKVIREDSTKTDSTTSLSSSSSGENRQRQSRREARQESSGAFPTSRGRSQSRTREEARGRSASRTSQSRGRSSSRPKPVTVQQQRRARSRSASLTRVTGPDLPPTSPSMARRRPPSTFRSQNDMRQSRGQRSNSIGPGVRNQKSKTVSDDRSVGSDANIGRNISFGRQRSNSSAGMSTSSDSHRKSLREKLFGEQGKKKSTANILAGVANGRDLRPRVLLAATVYHNTATNLWIATINTNQRGVAKNPALASKYLKAFSFPTEREARESAIANAPPKMVPFKDAANCFVCDAQFALFRRASHCRNCGVCICSNCSTTWPSKCLPDTYNLKHETNLKICRTCDALSAAFKKSLMKGGYEEAIAIYGTGNINLRNPFPPSKKDEIMFPVHCAVEGGNLDLLRWLMDDHYCPIKVSSRSGSKKSKRSDVLIQTSKGRSVLSIAVERLQVDIMRYLIVDHNISVFELTDLKSSLRALEATLVRLPRHGASERVLVETSQVRWDNDQCDFDEISVPSSLGESDYDAGTIGSKSLHTKGTKGASECIICFDQKIDCVATPCGHQVCCLKCSKSLKSCPVCNSRGDFIKIFRP